MKIISLNAVKRISIVLTLLCFMLISCNNPKKNNNPQEKEEVAIIDKDNVDIALQEDVSEIKTRTYKMKNRVLPIVYHLDTNGIVGFDDWADYTVVNYELANIKTPSNLSIRKRLDNLNYRVANLKNTIPDWLKTEEVLKNVVGIQKEYVQLIKDKDASEDEINVYLGELSEKLDYLKKELSATVDEYVEIHKDDIEEFN